MSSTRTWLLIALAVEVSLLVLERTLVATIGQQPIAAAMLTAPGQGVALLGAAAVVARIGGRALFPALVAFLGGAILTRAMLVRALDRRPER